MKVKRRNHEFFLLIVSTAVCGLALLATNELEAVGKETPSASNAALAGELVDAEQLRGALVGHVGCGSGRMTAALYEAGASLVHGLDASEKAVTRARRYITGKNCYGRVSVAHWRGDRLPYAGGTLDLLVVESPDSV